MVSRKIRDSASQLGLGLRSQPGNQWVTFWTRLLVISPVVSGSGGSLWYQAISQTSINCQEKIKLKLLVEKIENARSNYDPDSDSLPTEMRDVFQFLHPLNLMDILFSASHLSITLRNSSREIRSSYNSHVTISRPQTTLTSEISISAMNLSAILFSSFWSIPSTIWARTVNSSS